MGVSFERSVQPSVKVDLSSPSEDWQRAAWEEMDKTSDNFIESAEWSSARKYLLGRGLNRETCMAWDIGAEIVFGRPATVILHVDGEQILGIEDRFIDALARQDPGRRFMARTESCFGFYDLSMLTPDCEALMFCEGEFNALSLWQVSMRRIGVVSFGSQSVSNEQMALARVLTAKFRRVVAWMDEPEKAREVAGELARPDALLLKSPGREGVKFEANALLQHGKLSKFLRYAAGAECANPDGGR